MENTYSVVNLHTGLTKYIEKMELQEVAEHQVHIKKTFLCVIVT